MKSIYEKIGVFNNLFSLLIFYVKKELSTPTLKHRALLFKKLTVEMFFQICLRKNAGILDFVFMTRIIKIKYYILYCALFYLNHDNLGKAFDVINKIC